jgi:hypothetical protein
MLNRAGLLNLFCPAGVAFCLTGIVACSGQISTSSDPSDGIVAHAGTGNTSAGAAAVVDPSAPDLDAGGTGAGGAAGLPVRPAGTTAMRRLTASQFRHSLQALLGEAISISDVESDARASGLAVVDAANVITSTTGVEQYHAAIEGALEQVFATEQGRLALLGCTPTLATTDVCTRDFLARFGKLALRRTLSATELARYVGLANLASGHLDDPFLGIQWALTALLESPKFLYRTELGAPSVERTDANALSPPELAAKMAFFLWDGPPDAELIDKAESGALASLAGLREEAERLLTLPAGRRAISGFARDLYWMDRLDTVAKDPTLYPAFTATLRSAMKEEFLHKWEDVVFDQDVSAFELFRTRRTQVNAELATLYGLDVADATPDTFVATELPADGERLGIFGSAGWLTLFGNQKKGSATLRGKFVREVVMCNEIPEPPDNIDTDLPDPQPGLVLTEREILAQHATQPACAACHSLMDPIGFAFERFDGIGGYRTMDAGKPVDASGSLNGVNYDGLPGLIDVLLAEQRTQSCLVEHLYSYALGTLDSPGEADAVAALTATFVAGGSRIKPLLVELVASEGFRFVVPAP